MRFEDMKTKLYQNYVQQIRSLPRFLILLVALLITLTPIVWIIFGSFKSDREVLAVPMRWLPSDWVWNNYIDAWQEREFSTYAKNSAIMTIFIVFGHLFLASLAGYGFAKFKFPGQRISFIFILSTMMLPVQVIMIPLFILMKGFGWVDTYWGLIVPIIVNAFGVFFMRQYILSIPDDLIDAARVDGASEIIIYFKIVLPLCKPALAGLGTLVGMAAWGAFLWPLLVSTSEEMFTLPIGISLFKTNYWTPFNWLLAISVLISIPPIIAFALTQRQLVESGALTGMK